MRRRRYVPYLRERPYKPKPGTCRKCGCTNERACPGTGCAWANDERTLCTACLPKLTGEELLVFANAEAQGHETESMPPLMLDVSHAIRLVAVLDLALRHPAAHDTSRPSFQTARLVRDGLAEHLARIGPATAELLRRGQDPQYDR